MTTTASSDLEDGRRMSVHPPSVYTAFSGSSPVKTRDGVFSNMVGADSGLPSSAIYPVPARPPVYEEVASMRPPNYSVDAPAIFRLLSSPGHQHDIRPPTLADVLVDGITLGSWTSFFGPLVIVLVSQFVGFLLVLMVVRSHAGHHGAFAGLGLLLVVTAISGELESYGATGKQELGLSVLDPFLLIAVVAVGLALFFFSFYSYARLRTKASVLMMDVPGMENA